MSDIVERLQEASVCRLAKGEMLSEAAGEIERLRGYLVEHEVMRAKLAKVREWAESPESDYLGWLAHARSQVLAILNEDDV